MGGVGDDRFAGLPVHELAGGHRIVVADSRRSRMRGLSRLEALPPATGLHIPRCRSIQTMSMRFPLDLVWLDGDGAVVRVDHAVPPRRMKTCRRARSVVECDAGAADGFLAAGLQALRLV
jgi:uncharacterized membrane protein (UPF0127 family)